MSISVNSYVNTLSKKSFDPKNVKIFSRCSYQLSQISQYNFTEILEQTDRNTILHEVFGDLFFKDSKVYGKSKEYRTFIIAYIQLFSVLINVDDIEKLLKISDLSVEDFPELKKNGVTDLYDFLMGFINYVKKNSNIIRVQSGGDDEIIEIERQGEFGKILNKRRWCGLNCVLFITGIAGSLLTVPYLFKSTVETTIEGSYKITSDITEYANKVIVNEGMNKVLKECLEKERCGLNELSAREFIRFASSKMGDDADEPEYLYDGDSFEQISSFGVGSEMIEGDELIINPDIDYAETDELLREIGSNDKYIEELEEKIKIMKKSLRESEGIIIIKKDESIDDMLEAYKKLLDETKERNKDIKEIITLESKKDITPKESRITKQLKERVENLSLTDYSNTILYFLGYNSNPEMLHEMADFHISNVKKVIPELVKLTGDSFEKASKRAIKNIRSETSGMYLINKISNMFLGVNLYESQSTTSIISKSIDTFQKELSFHLSKITQIISENSEDSYHEIVMKSNFYISIMFACFLSSIFAFANLVHISGLPKQIKFALLFLPMIILNNTGSNLTTLFYGMYIMSQNYQQIRGGKGKKNKPSRKKKQCKKTQTTRKTYKLNRKNKRQRVTRQRVTKQRINKQRIHKKRITRKK